ncbi:MAG: hypothetical protein L6R19_23980 [Alphaproteobacteria bacterium]|nr:hypothetical protein [Alphaproteobacteria bacterium]
MTAVRGIEQASPQSGGSADAWCDLALGRHLAGDGEAALDACRRALALDPAHAAARLNLACILRELDRLEEAAMQAESVAVLARNRGDAALLADARFNRALALLGLGRLEDAWADYDARLALPPWTRFAADRRWRGEKLGGRGLVLRREQGIGDELMFASLYPKLVRSAQGQDGGAVTIECDARLAAPLARSLPGTALHPIDTVAGRAAAAAGLPPPPGAARAVAGDCWAAAGSLPGILGLPEHHRDDSPLLSPLPELAVRWRQRLAALPGRGPLVGLCWRTSLSTGRRDRLQAAIAELAPLIALADVRFVSLQIGARPDELAELAARAGRQVADFPDLDLANDLEQALALVAGLDLVVSVGTWIVPLAGAAGTRACYLAALRDYWTLGGERVAWFAGARAYRASPGYADAAAAVAADIVAAVLP